MIDYRKFRVGGVMLTRERTRPELSTHERRRLLSARDRLARAQADYDVVFVDLVDQHGAGAVSRVLGVSLQAVHERAQRLRGR